MKLNEGLPDLRKFLPSSHPLDSYGIRFLSIETTVLPLDFIYDGPSKTPRFGPYLSSKHDSKITILTLATAQKV